MASLHFTPRDSLTARRGAGRGARGEVKPLGSFEGNFARIWDPFNFGSGRNKKNKFLNFEPY
eukprot:3020724-Rhodomonas_salina.1